jgi:ribonucleoside-diphosphate reductase alpha chain/ribonucleoside-triphosphate reductase
MFLSDKFVSQYKDRIPPFGGNGMGEIVYLRTYSRFLPELGRREEWYETVRRVVEYNMSLHKGTAGNLIKEAETLFDLIFNLKVFPAGRSLWVGGTDAANKFPLANFNCSFRVVDDISAFTEIFYLLMLGCGTGFRVLPSDVEKIPNLRNNVVLTHLPYNYVGSKEETKLKIENRLGFVYTIIVGDSKEGWVDALKLYFKILQTNDIPVDIEIDYNHVRPAGSLLKTFGGRASGPEGLKMMFENIHNVIQNAPKVFESCENICCGCRECNGSISLYSKLRPIDAMDIMNNIAYNVVVGGVRRSSQICLFDINDEEILNAKKDLYVEGSSNYGKNWRAMSNNSIFFHEKPTKDQLRDIFKRIKNNGEPGFLNAESARKRRPNFQGINPCAEILLDSQGVCNLTEVNLMGFIVNTPYEDYDFDENGLIQAIKYATRIGLRMTNVNLELGDWDRVQKRDRLTGVSLTGVMDAFDKLNYSPDQQERVLSILREVAKKEAETYAAEQKINNPLLVTTVKPSGTISQLPTVSSGVHRGFAPYYIRRIRVTSSDPIAEVLKNKGYPVYPETGQGPSVEEYNKLNWFQQRTALDNANTWVFEFPVKTDTLTDAEDENAINQFHRYLQMQRTWTEHNTSITIYFSDDEIEILIDEILRHWNEYIAVSFLPKSSNAYPLMPYEKINETEYLRRLSSVNATNIKEELNLFESGEQLDDVLDASCATGICPVR